MKTINQLMKEVSATKAASKWREAVKGYALDLLGSLYEQFQWDRDANKGPRRSDKWLEENCITTKQLHRKLLAGAPNWHEYSWGGCALIYNDDLAKALLTRSERKWLGWKEDSNGNLYGGRSEWGEGKKEEKTLLDVQERALMQAERLIAETIGYGDEQMFILQNLD